MSSESESQIESSQQFRLGYLFFVITMMAIGFGLCAGPFHPAAKGIGMGIVAFWLSRGIFSISMLMPKGARETVFLLGLPIYIGAMMLLLGSSVYAIVEIVEHFSRG